MSEERRMCPACGRRAGVPIVWGMVMPEDMEREDVVYGGCVVPADPPTTVCRACDHQWRPTD